MIGGLKMHRPLHVWQLDENGNCKLDKHGNKIPHKRQGQAKKESELTPEDIERRKDQLFLEGERNRKTERDNKLEAFIDTL